MSAASSARERPGVIVSYRDAVARAAPSMVTVRSSRASKGPLPLAARTLVKGLGSGVIVDREGYIVPNCHVVEGDSGARGRVGGRHVAHDARRRRRPGIGHCAAQDRRRRRAADRSRRYEPRGGGRVVLAVGDPLGVGQTVTQGIVSAVARKGVDPVENSSRPTRQSIRATRAAR